MDQSYDSNVRGGAHPFVFTFPQVQPDGQVFQNWYDVICEKPSGLTEADFAPEVPDEVITKWWRTFKVSGDPERIHSKPVYEEVNNNSESRQRNRASSSATNSVPEGDHNYNYPPRRTYEPRPPVSVPFSPPGIPARASHASRVSNASMYNGESSQLNPNNSLKVYVPQFGGHGSARSRSTSTHYHPPDSSSLIATEDNQIVPYGYRHPPEETPSTSSAKNTNIVRFDDPAESSDSDHSDDPPPVMICRFCDTNFKGKPVEAFICHLALKEQIECLFCSASFGCEGAWMSHYKTTHVDMFPALRPECHLCKKTFANRLKITNHMLTHSKTKNFQCVKCKQTYRTCRSLLSHVTVPKKKKNVSGDMTEPEIKAKSKASKKCKVRITDYPAVMSSIYQ